MLTNYRDAHSLSPAFALGRSMSECSGLTPAGHLHVARALSVLPAAIPLGGFK